jgi:hypothetical protein
MKIISHFFAVAGIGFPVTGTHALEVICFSFQNLSIYRTICLYVLIHRPEYMETTFNSSTIQSLKT